MLEAKREKVSPRPVTLYHGATDYIFPEEQIDVRRGDFHMTDSTRTAAGYAFNEFSKSAETEGVPSTDPTVLRFQADLNRFMVNNIAGANVSGASRMGDQASRRAARARETMEQEIQQQSGDRRQGIEQQVARLLAAGKGTQGQRGFEGIIRNRPKSDEVEYVVPQGGRLDLTRTGTTEKIEDPDEFLEFVPQNIPQTRIATPKVERPNIGVSAFRGIQVTGPRLTKIASRLPDRGNFYDLAPLDGDGDGIHASLDSNDPINRKLK